MGRYSTHHEDQNTIYISPTLLIDPDVGVFRQMRQPQVLLRLLRVRGNAQVLSGPEAE